MLSIENKRLKIGINPKGAELQSIFHKEHRLEYLWNGDPAFWGKHSPLLFPIVGTLKEDTYSYEGKNYSLGRHGFAREKVFAIEKQEPESVTFLLQNNTATREIFPFAFDLRVTYRLAPNGLQVIYSVKNPSDKDLYFSIGGHPAFKVPLVDGTVYNDYFLEFDEKETAPRWPISKDGLIEKTPLPFLKDTSKLPLTKELFAQDALVFKGLSSTEVSLRSAKTKHGLSFDFTGFPYLGIWAAQNADFVCIEPWCGIADNVDTDQQFTGKEGINKLGPKEEFERDWTVSFF